MAWWRTCVGHGFFGQDGGGIRRTANSPIRDPAEGYGPGSFGAAGAGGKLLRAVKFCTEADWREGAFSGRRSGLELRGQRDDLRTHELQRRVRTAGST